MVIKKFSKQNINTEPFFFTDILSINALVRTRIDNDQELKYLSHIYYRYFIWW